MGYIFLLLSIAALIVGVYKLSKQNQDGSFNIVKRDDKFILWYNHRGEWVEDSEHFDFEDAVKKIRFYLTRRADKSVRLNCRF